MTGKNIGTLNTPHINCKSP